MNKFVFWLVITAVSLILNPLQASELSVTGYVDRTTIGLNDQLKLTIEISGSDAGKLSQPELPEISGFRNIGTSTSSSSSFSIVNGRMTSTVTRSFVYTLRPQATGTFLIPPVSIQHENQTLTTDPIRITVIEGTTQPPPVSGRLREREREPEPDETDLADNIFILAELSKSSVVRGEPLILNYQLYSRYDLANLSYLNEPNFTGFWKEDLYFANRMNFRRTTYQGRAFNVMTLRQVALYPNQSGTLTIPPLEITTEIIIRPRTFFDFDRTRRFNVASEPVTINVRELPAEGRPETFTGAVGSFSISSRISDTDLTVGDTFTYTLTITGHGNFKHFDTPPFPKLPVIRTIDPETVTESQPDSNRMRGSKTIRYPVIVREEGNHTIPPLVFAFYDSERNVYRTLQTDSYDLNVEPSEFRTIPHSVAQQDVLPEGVDISYIYRTANLNSASFISDSYIYWLFWVLIIMSIPLAYYYRLEQDRLAADSSYLRKKQARKILSKYLQKATEAAKKGNTEFYGYVTTGLQNYLTDNLKIPRGSTTEKIISEIQQKKFTPETVQRVKDTINRCLEARFMPGGFEKERITKDYENVKDVISLISRQRRS